MAKNLSLNQIRFEKAVFDSYDSVTENTKQRENVKKALGRIIQKELTPRQRQIVIMCCCEDRSVSDTANELGLNKSTVSRHLNRAKEKIERTLSYTFNPFNS